MTADRTDISTTVEKLYRTWKDKGQACCGDWRGVGMSRWAGREISYEAKIEPVVLNYPLDDSMWERFFFLCLLSLLLVYFSPQMASALSWWPAGSSDLRSIPIWQLFCQEGRAGLETRCWHWYHRAIYHPLFSILTYSRVTTFLLRS